MKTQTVSQSSFISKFSLVLDKLRTVKVQNLDLDKKWYRFVLQNWNYYIPVMLVQGFREVFNVLIPFFLSYIFLNQRLDYLVYFVIALAVISIADFLAISIYVSSIASFMQSTQYSMVDAVLKTDPVKHVQRESGKLLAKIDRSVRCIESFMDAFFYNIFVYMVSVSAVVVLAFSFDFILGGIVMIFIFLIISSAFLGKFLISDFIEPQVILSEDQLAQITTESVIQNSYIRSIFATHSQLNRLKKSTYNMAKVNVISWLTQFFVDNIPKFIFIFSVFAVGFYSLELSASNVRETFEIVAFMVSYIYGVIGIQNISEDIEHMRRNYLKFINGWESVKEFKKQTFPV